MDVHVDGEAIEEWRRSYFLIFVLLCLNQEVTEGDRAGVVEAFNKQCLWDQLLSAEPTRKRRREEEERFEATQRRRADDADENEDVLVVEVGGGSVSEGRSERCGESVADEELERRPGVEDTANWE